MITLEPLCTWKRLQEPLLQETRKCFKNWRSYPFFSKIHIKGKSILWPWKCDLGILWAPKFSHCNFQDNTRNPMQKFYRLHTVRAKYPTHTRLKRRASRWSLRSHLLYVTGRGNGLRSLALRLQEQGAGSEDIWIDGHGDGGMLENRKTIA